MKVVSVVVLCLFYLVTVTLCLQWSDEKKITVDVTTFPVPGNGMSMHYAPFDIMSPFAHKNFAWTTMTIQIVDPVTKQVIPSPQIYNHHVLVMNNGQTDVWCKKKDNNMFTKTIVSAAGSDYTPINLPRPNLYLVYNSTTNWFINWHVINYQNQTRNVTLQFLFTYLTFNTESDLPRGCIPVRTMFISSEPHCESEFDVPGNNTPSTIFVRSRLHISPVSGNIVYALGHLHRGGIYQQLIINNKVVCDAVSTYEDGWIKQGGAGICGNMSVRLNVGDLVDDLVVYNNTNYITEAMGLFLVWIQVDQAPSPSSMLTATSAPTSSNGPTTSSTPTFVPPPPTEIITVEESDDKTVKVISIICLCLLLVLLAMVVAIVIFNNRMYRIMRANYTTDFSFE